MGEGGQEWPLALSSAPPASTYSADRGKQVAAQHCMPAQDVPIGEVAVKYSVELDGTIVACTTKAQAGKQSKPQNTVLSAH